MTVTAEDRVATRRDVLASFGASSGAAEELLRYNENQFQSTDLDLTEFPLPDESFVEAWREYAAETDLAGSILPVSKYLVQLQFPVEEGMSERSEYIDATRRGIETGSMQSATGLRLRAPERCRIVIHPTVAGRMPLLIAEEREDFVALLRALTRKNEPSAIPASMGASMVSGYNNWHRIAILRSRFLSQARPGTWDEEFLRIKSQKELYQDRFIILSKGSYSAVNPSDFGLDHEEWLNLSSIIRREHECTHYFTRRVFSSMRNNLLDELIADYVGITAAAGRFHASWLLAFLGLENFPKYRPGGRLENYRGNPPLSDAAFSLLQKVVNAAAASLEDFDRSHIPEFEHAALRPALLKMLTRLTVEEMASGEVLADLGREFAREVKARRSPPGWQNAGS
jgi:hypothetical protein